jgi:uncharacterized protein (TIGR03083 family)
VVATGTVPVDLTAARAAVEVAARQAADLVGSLPDPSRRVPGLDWTVGQTAAHLVAAARLYPRLATGQFPPEATIDLAEGNLQRIAQVGNHALAELADLLVGETQRLLEQTADLAPDHRVAFHGGTTLDLAAQTGILLGEYLIHGLDLARSAQRLWPIDPGHARLVIAAATALLPRYLDPDAARGVTVGYDVRIRGGPRFGLRVADGAATVESGRVVPVDCHISADPVAFLIVAYGRGSPWPPTLRGKVTAWGRKPWRAFGLTRLLMNP